MSHIIDQLEASLLRSDLPRIQPGDTVKVHVKVKEGEKERIQLFQGIVIGIKGGGMRTSFTVRKVASGVGVERIFPLNSPTIDKMEVVRHGKVRRAKLYFLREVSGKKARIREKKDWLSRKHVAVPAEGTAERPDAEAAGAPPAAPDATPKKE